jgi:hypothetical protein
MKRILIVGVLLSLSACASWYGKDSNAGHNKLSQSSNYSSGLDDKYMARVERQAQQRGVVVKWIHPPKAPKSDVAKRDNQ